MVVGLDVFKQAFAGFEGQYVLIGGAAAELHLEAAGLEFRSTKDLDIVLCLEALDTDFVAAFWAFIEAGGYEVRERSDGEKEFFRFHRPKDAAYPAIIELFSRVPDVITVSDNARYTPIPSDGMLESLSAMLLDDVYYELLRQGSSVIEGVSVLDVKTLIPFKAYAYNNLARDKAQGAEIDTRKITKHRNDVFKLMQLAPGDASLTLPDAVKADMTTFVAAVEADDAFNPKSLGLAADRATTLGRIRTLYCL